MRRVFSFLFVLFILASCTAQPQQPAQQTPSCKVFEISTPTGCCRDLNDNKVCDTVDFAANITAAQEREAALQAEKARERAQQSGQYLPTIVNELYANASRTLRYRFMLKGDEIVVINNTITRKLHSDYPLGDQMVNGRRMKVVVNAVSVDPLGRNATAVCIPPPAMVAQGRNTQCDDIKDAVFTVPYDVFAFTMPTDWLKDLLYRTPFEILPGNHVGTITGTLYRFTDLKDAHRVTNLWVDDTLAMPIRVEVRKDGTIESWQEYDDLYRI